ncbi:hypothetical protein HG536_0B05890 [Torulaspora globosa]|uniref:Copper-fist domain-containing protein n=1 Tax=Torulaspora globosa TaxID=48254 RepID=A0A7G3ZDY7_9SACH|nr:uncharacterized protein HG536_0B05890 [Torulaspora globosa]QLL31723.1 hypothetical protein HG536_0B05890 [Torulaspora globosa]
MVLINNVKYACERCIRGHRVTTCNHTDQPLMMIKPKGRPSTTCDHCKELRKNKKANPTGVCTCGRLEKKRLAQKAKEEARAKAKEEKRLHDCRCDKQEPCKCHSTRRRSRKVSVNHEGVRRSNSNSNVMVGQGHVASPVSMETFNDNSYVESDVSGKISKDYHHVPSLASISSFHSTQSLDHKFALPQSPTLGNFVTGTNTNGNGHWDNSSICSSVRSDSRANLSDAVSVGLDPLNNTKRVTPMTRTRVGEVTVPLEEYIPSDINGIGKINDTSSLIDDWSFENPAGNRNVSASATYANSNANSFLQSHDINGTRNDTNNGLLDMFLDSSNIPFSYDRNNSAPLGLGKRYSVHSPQSGTHHYSNVSDNANAEPASNTNNMNNSNTKQWDAPETSLDNESVRSVEVLSLTPSFMDIPERVPNHQQQQHSRPSIESRKSKQRSSSLHRNHRYPPTNGASQSYNVRPAPITINPSMVSSVDDNVSTNSLQSPTGSLNENGLMTGLTDAALSKYLPDRMKFPRSTEPQDKSSSQNPQGFQRLQQPQRQSPQDLRSSTGMNLDIDKLMGFDGASIGGMIDNRTLDKENGRPLFQENFMSYANPSAKTEIQDSPRIGSNQTSSSPSQLLTEKSFADLDNFMSIL